MLSYLKNYYFESSCKKSENFSHSMARKSQKTLFWGQFGPILAQNGPKNLPKEILSCHILQIIILKVHEKNQKIFATLWRENHKNPYFGVNLGPFWPNTGQKITEKKIMLSYLNNYYFVSSCKKSENFSHSMARKLQKTLFLGQFGPIFAQNRPKNLPKKI